MMMRLVSLALAAVAALGDDWAVQEADVPLHNPATSNWVMGERPAPEQPMTLTAMLRVDEERRQALERTLFEVSDPDSPKYGQHLTASGLGELLAVPEERVRAVSEHFKAHGATDVIVAPSRDVITLKLTVSAVEQALKTELRVFRHKESQKVAIVRASSSYSLPREVAESVVMVGELLQFPHLPRPLAEKGAGAGSWPNACDVAACKGLVTPAVITQRYKLPKGEEAAAEASGASMAVAEFQGQYFVKDDLKKFGQACHVDCTVDKVIGGDQPIAGVESELDIEYIKAAAPGIPLTVVYNDQYSLLSWANEITGLSGAPSIQSVSYGNDEAQQTGVAFMKSCNTAFMKAGTMGISILFASGDQGVCGREGCGYDKVRFNPDFPAASPYITAVGGTDFLSNDIGDEMAWSASGGGFSDTFPAPDFQKAAVQGYFSSPDAELPDQSYWNRTGRGYPDVAALGGLKTPYCVASSGSFQGVSGTSASCPVVAGVFAQLNAQRLAKGKPVMGFLNPFIYKNPSGFQDVTHGRNGAGQPKLGFKAVKGWDPATGFGTPDFEALSKLSMAAVQSQAEVVV